MSEISDKWSIARARHIQAIWPIRAYFDWEIKEYYGIPSSGKIIHIWDKGFLTAIFEIEPRKHLVKAVIEILKANADSLEELREKGIVAGREVVQFAKDFAGGIENKSIQDIVQFLKEFPSKHMPLMRDNMFYWLIAALPLEQQIRQSLAQYGDKADEIFITLSQPNAPSYSQLIENEFRALVNLAKVDGINSDSLKQAIATFVDKNFWFPYEYVGPEIWTEEGVLKRVAQEVDQESVATENNVAVRQAAITQEFGISKEIQKDFEILRTLTLMQDDRKMFMAHMSYYLNGVIFGEIAKRFNLSWDGSHYIDEELLSVSENDSEGFKRELEKRTDFVISVQEDQQTEFLTQQEARDRLNELGVEYGKASDQNKELRGQSANGGIAKGRVRVLKSSQVEHFENGDIIVTGMTTPDFAPLIKKSAGIITNEGGITCHAAIVARELNIPCVIGTKIATQILKDGDMVEVDADKGVVKILN